MATVGNTLGGMIDYGMGLARSKLFARAARQTRWFGWLQRFGPKTMLLSWLPGHRRSDLHLGRLAAAAVLAQRLYMAIGKFLRYL